MDFLSNIYNYIKRGETSCEGFGLEIEHFVVNDKGTTITFDEVVPLIENVASSINANLLYMDGYTVGYECDDYSITLEPSCQFEISISPNNDLSRIKDIYDNCLKVWEPLFEERGYKLLTKGLLPLVEEGKVHPGDLPLIPKNRYIYMDAYFVKSGRYGKYMMRSSASAQVSIDYRSEEDLVKKLRVLQKISPLLMLIMENKSNVDSTLLDKTKPYLLRTQVWDDLDPDRTGFYPHSFDDDFGYNKIAEVVYNTPLILLTDKGVTFDVGSRTAKDLEGSELINEDNIDSDRMISLIEHFISMEFFHFRIKKYIEIRIADSVPIDKALGYIALLKGLIYSNSTLDIIDNELSEVDSIDKIQGAIEEIEVNGFDAIIYEGKSARHWVDYLYDLAASNITSYDNNYLNELKN